MKNIDWSKVEEPKTNSYPAKIVPGGYVCKITKVEDYEDKEYLKVSFDISDGASEGFAQSAYDSFGKWPSSCSTVRSYKDSAQSFFKGFITALEESNKRFTWDNNRPQKAVGCEMGVIMAEEEYRANDGSVKVSIKPRTICSVDRIESGNYTVPGRKTLDGTVKKNDGMLELKELTDNDEDLPF